MTLVKNIAKIALCTLVYVLVHILMGILLPMSPALSAIPEGERWMTMPALFLMGAVFSAIILYYCRKSSRPTSRLMPLVALAMFFVGTVQTQIETWYFRKAFTILTDADLALIVVYGLIASLVFAPLSILIFRRGAKSGIDFPEAERDYRFDRRWWTYVLAALAYLPFYLGFGLLAKIAPVLSATYEGWIADDKLVALLPLWTVFRGFLFMGIAALIVSLFPKRAQARLALALTLSLFISIALAAPSVLMPSALRLVHFLEVTISMVLYSIVIVALILRPRAASPEGV